MALDTANIKGINGEISAHVFGRSLNWIINVRCSPVTIEGEEREVSIGCEWIKWPIRSWEALGDMGLSKCEDIGSIEASFYLAEHHPMTLTELKLERIDNSSRFKVVIKGKFDLAGFGEYDGSNLSLEISSELDFEGIIVVPNNLPSKPSTEEEICVVVAQHIELDSLSTPKNQGFRYLLEPNK